MRDIVTDLTDIAQKEIQAAKLEVREDLARVQLWLGLLTVGGSLALVGVVCIAYAAFDLLTQVVEVEAWVGGLSVGVVLLALSAAAMYWGGRSLRAVVGESWRERREIALEKG